LAADVLALVADGLAGLGLLDFATADRGGDVRPEVEIGVSLALVADGFRGRQALLNLLYALGFGGLLGVGLGHFSAPSGWGRMGSPPAPVWSGFGARGGRLTLAGMAAAPGRSHSLRLRCPIDSAAARTRATVSLSAAASSISPSRAHASRRCTVSSCSAGRTWLAWRASRMSS